MKEKVRRIVTLEPGYVEKWYNENEIRKGDFIAFFTIEVDKFDKFEEELEEHLKNIKGLSLDWYKKNVEGGKK